jgi:hypothetical protein
LDTYIDLKLCTLDRHRLFLECVALSPIVISDLIRTLGRDVGLLHGHVFAQ